MRIGERVGPALGEVGGECFDGDDGAVCPGAKEAAGVEYTEESGSSLYFRDPDGARLELISDPLGEMYGLHVL